MGFDKCSKTSVTIIASIEFFFIGNIYASPWINKDVKVGCNI